MGAFLSVVGLIGFIVFIVLAVVNLVKKSGKAKRNFGIATGLFVLFIVGVVSMDTPESAQNASQAETEQTEEENEKPETNKEEAAEEQEEEQKPDPVTVADIQQAVKKDMSESEFHELIEKIELKSMDERAIGNSQKGYVLQAEEGFVYVNSDGEKILGLKQFEKKAGMKEHEKKLKAAAEKAEKEKAKKMRKEMAINLSGTGDTASDGFELKAGWATFTASHKGASNFAAHLQDEAGNDLELLVNTIGNYQGTTFAQIPAEGTYYMNVTADGNWDFTIHQTSPADIPQAPTTFEGTGDDVVFFTIKNGNYKFTFDHSGESNFAVLLNGSNLLVNEIGTYNGSTRQKLQDDGMYLFSVTADGDWSIKIEE